MEDFLINLGAHYAGLSYVIIVILAAIEGPILSMILGVLVELGYFSLVPIFFSLMIGDLLGDVIWYYIGYHYGYRFVDRYGKYVNVNRDSIEKVLGVFRRHGGKILFISKISNGLTLALAILITAGIAKIPFLKYFTINTLGQFIWTGLLLSIGYFFGNIYVQVDSWLSRISIIALFLVAMAAFMGYKKYMSSKVENS